jgi:hypothetical protein
MESYLSNRPKLPGSFESMDPSEGLAFQDPLASTDNFLAGLPRTGGFQSLKSALLEAGSVVDPADVDRAQRNKESQALQAGGAHHHEEHFGEPSVELIKNNGRIEKVIVTCSCSKRIELDCSY